jgi:hypothetical protein
VLALRGAGLIVWFAVLAAEFLALACAVRFTRRTPSGVEDRTIARGPDGGDVPAHTFGGSPLVLLLAFAVVVDVLLAVGDCRVLGDPRAVLAVVVPCVPPAPRGGLASAVRLAEQALAMAWPCALMVTSWRVFSGLRSRWAMGVAVCVWLVAGAVLVLARPYGHPGDDPAARVARAAFVARLLLAVELAAVAGGVVAVWRAWTPARRWGSSPVHAAALVLLATEAAVATIGPFVRDPFSDWDAARALYVVGFVAVAGVLARGTRSRSSTSSTSTSADHRGSS